MRAEEKRCFPEADTEAKRTLSPALLTPFPPGSLEAVHLVIGSNCCLNFESQGIWLPTERSVYNIIASPTGQGTTMVNLSLLSAPSSVHTYIQSCLSLSHFTSGAFSSLWSTPAGVSEITLGNLHFSNTEHQRTPSVSPWTLSISGGRMLLLGTGTPSTTATREPLLTKS